MPADCGALRRLIVGAVGAIVAVVLTIAMLVLGQPDPEGPVMTAREVMAVTGFSENFVYAALLDGRIPGRIACGRRVLVSRAVFERWLAGTSESLGERNGA